MSSVFVVAILSLLSFLLAAAAQDPGCAAAGGAIPLVVSTRGGDRMVACAAGLAYLRRELGSTALRYAHFIISWT